MENKQLEPVLCVLNPDDQFDVIELPHGNLISRGCVTPYQIKQLEEAGVVFPKDKPINDGLVLVKHPTKDEYYYRTEETDKGTIQHRIFAIQRLISYLGGKDMVILETASTHVLQKNGVDVGVAAKFPVEGVPASVEAKSSTSISSTQNNNYSASLRSEWPGTYTISGYNEALCLAEQTGLISDPSIGSILDQRNPSHPNPLKREHYSVKIASDLQKTFNTLNSLSGNFGDIGVKLDVDIKSELFEGKELTYDFEVSFGELIDESLPKDKKNKSIIYGVLAGLGVGLITILVLLLTGVI